MADEPDFGKMALEWLTWNSQHGWTEAQLQSLTKEIRCIYTIGRASRDAEVAEAQKPVQLRVVDITEMQLCEDCPPLNYPTDRTRCGPCPRRAAIRVAAEGKG
jgi:hypothetical protein